jgi:hypothetical protein
MCYLPTFMYGDRQYSHNNLTTKIWSLGPK